MDYVDTWLAIEQVARKNGMDVNMLVEEIDLAIEDAMKSDDPLVQARWMCIPCRGERPTALEFVAYMRSLVHGRRTYL